MDKQSRGIVLGMGKSGEGAYCYLQALGVTPIGIEENPAKRIALKEKGFQVVSEIDFVPTDLVVLSPGIPLDHPLVKKASSLGVDVLGELELSLRDLHQKMVAVTGTNGKTTVTLLVEHVLNSSGKKAKAVGNVGLAMTEYLLSSKRDREEILVVEVSSYQLESLKTPCFDLGVVLNITPDHLERHGSMEEYARVKLSLGSKLCSGAPLIVQSEIVDRYRPYLPKEGSFSTFGTQSSASLWTDGKSVRRLGKELFLFPEEFGSIPLHDSENFLAAWSLCEPLGVSIEQFKRALTTFRKPPHRIELVRVWNGISFYDDSKGTNIDATIQAVRSVPGDVVLIAGGVDKGSSYLPWKEVFQNRVRGIFVIGAAAKNIEKELSPYFPIFHCSSLEQAVKEAASFAKMGDTVLLSPGCSSFDMFSDYVHRGKVFQRAAALLG